MSNRNPIYPGHLVERGSNDRANVTLIQKRLNELGCGSIAVDGDFGKQTEKAVKLFQIRTIDATGQPLKIDGVVGAITWACLFGADTVPVRTSTSNLLRAAIIEEAKGQLGVTEEPPYSNRGPMVDQFVKATGLDPAGRFAWCACFVYWCVTEAAQRNQMANPGLREAGVQNLWRKASSQAKNGSTTIYTISASEAENNPGLLKPGMIFCLSRGRGLGHTGFIEEVQGGKVVTIEGNTNASQSYTGGGVWRHTRNLSQINLGYIEYKSTN